MIDQEINPTDGSCSLILSAFFLFPLIGFFLGLGINYGVFLLGNNPYWRTIPAPPSPAIELVAASPGCVYTKTVDHNNYQFCDTNGNWEKFEEVESDVPGQPCPGEFTDTPDDALEIVEFCIAKEYIDNTQFALFDDGSIKIRRSQGTGWGSLYRGIFFSLGGVLLGLIIGVGYYAYRKINMNNDS